MRRDDIEILVREAGEKYDASLIEAARAWRQLSDYVLAAVLASIGQATQHDGDPTVNIVGVFAFIGFVHAAKLEIGGQEVDDDRSERASIALDSSKTTAEDIDKPWQLLAAEWMENVAEVQDAEGLTGEPEPQWFRKIAALLRKEPEYLARQKNKEIADAADDAIRGA